MSQGRLGICFIIHSTVSYMFNRFIIYWSLFQKLIRTFSTLIKFENSIILQQIRVHIPHIHIHLHSYVYRVYVNQMERAHAQFVWELITHTWMGRFESNENWREINMNENMRNAKMKWILRETIEWGKLQKNDSEWIRSGRGKRHAITQMYIICIYMYVYVCV